MAQTSPARSAEIGMMLAGDTDQRLSRLCCGLISDNNSHDQLTGSRQSEHAWILPRRTPVVSRITLVVKRTARVVNGRTKAHVDLSQKLPQKSRRNSCCSETYETDFMS
jgi:hypothetical protein